MRSLQGFRAVFNSNAGQIWQKALLSAEEISALKKHLIEKADPSFGGDSPDVFTIGQPLYKSAETNLDLQNYFTRAKNFQSEVFPRFAGLYSRIQLSLTAFLNAPVSFHSELASPGFLIYRKSIPKLSKPHFDLQARLLPAENRQGYDLNKVLTFTLAIDLPAKGSGLYYWPLSLKDLSRGMSTFSSVEDSPEAELWGFDRKKPQDMKFYNFLKTQEKQQLTYEAGSLYLTIGALLHQAGPTDTLSEGETRITLQGHGLFHQERGWELYW